MKILNLLMIAVVATSTASPDAFAGVASGTGIALSKHDINTLAGAARDDQQRICAFCHTPHHAMDPSAQDYMPLWSHNLTQQNYISYKSPTIEVDARNVTDPLAGPSRLCMSCHDGIIAADQHYGDMATGTKFLTGDSFTPGVNMAIGASGDLTRDHPIGFDYTKVAGAGANADGTDKRIFAADGTLTFRGNPAVLVRDQLYQGRIMTCATCHDVHNRDNNNGGAERNFFVYAPLKDSQLCLTCHDK